MTKLIIICLLVAGTLQLCQPLYWQVDPAYLLVTTEIENYANNQIINIPDQSQVISASLLNITDIVTKMKYNSKAKVTTINGSTVAVSGIVLSFDFTFHAAKNLSLTAAYNGSGKATLTNVNISFEKQFSISGGKAVFKLVAADVVPFDPILISSMDPEITNKNVLSQFSTLLNRGVYNELKNMLQKSYLLSLSTQLANQGFDNTFGGSGYNYSFNDISVLINTGIESITFGAKVGRKVGYNGTVANVQAECSDFAPTTQLSASYFTKGFISSIFSGFLLDPNFGSLVLDATNAASDIFQFYTIDLESIIPNALVDYPTLLGKLQVSCTLLPGDLNKVQISTDFNGLSAQIAWGCSLVLLSNNITFIKFNPVIKYNAKISQSVNKLTVTIKQIKLVDITFQQQEGYPLVNQDLAQVYINSVLANFNNKQTLGTSFKQPNRLTPRFTFSPEAITIVDGSAQILQ